MADYTDKIIRELESEGWTVSFRAEENGMYVACARRQSHTCVGQDECELGALIALKRSIRDLIPADSIRLISGHITVPNGDQFSRAVYVFGFESFQEQDRGVVTLNEGEMTRHEDGSIDAGVRYLSLVHQPELIPDEAAELCRAYDPMREVVFAIVAGDGKAMVIVLDLCQLHGR